MSISALGQQSIATTNPSAGGEAMQYRKASITSTQTAEIEITTAEGDKVTLSSTLQFEASSESYASYDQAGRSHGSHHHRNGGHARMHRQDPSTSTNTTSTSSTQKYSVSVEGDLSQQELQDIHKALQTLEQASSKMQSGNLDGAQNKLEKLGDLKTLSGLSANISIQQSATLETGTIVQAAA